MTPQPSKQITLAARLCLAAGLSPCASKIERRMRQRLDRLVAVHGCDRMAPRPFEDIALVCCDGAEGPAYELRVTGPDPDAALGELARLTLALVLRHPVSRIGWQPENAVLDRDTFLEALSPEPPRPVRRASLAATRIVPMAGAAVGDAGDSEEAVLRACLRRPVDRVEIAQMRRRLKLPGPERRVARAALAITTAVLAMNTSGAMAGVLSIGGVF